jgi:rubrerythrin
MNRMGIKKVFSEEELDFIKGRGYNLLKIDGFPYVILEDDNGYKYRVSYYSVRNGVSPYFVFKNNPFSVENIRLWLILKNKKYELISTKYEEARKNLIFKCKICNQNFSCNWNNLASYINCPVCEGKQVTDYNCLANVRMDLMDEWDYDKNDFSPFDVPKNSGKSAWWKCRICGFSWNTLISKRAGVANTQCPKCKSSKGEKMIEEWLKTNAIEYKKEKRFDGCFSKQKLPFDFFIPDFGLIEYDGILHYKNKFNDDIEFERTQINDKIKNEYCIKNQIPLLRIPYWKFDNIEQILEQTIFGNSKEFLAS